MLTDPFEHAVLLGVVSLLVFLLSERTLASVSFIKE